MATPETIHREIIEAFNKRDFSKIRDMLHPDYTYTGGDGEELSGPDAGVAVAQMYAQAFPDVRSELISTTAQGDRAVAEFRARGTHNGELLGVGPTGKPVDVRVCNVVELREGKIYREREYFDTATMWSQLGVTPPGRE